MAGSVAKRVSHDSDFGKPVRKHIVAPA